MIPTLLGIMILNFLIINMAPGGPIEHFLSKNQEMEEIGTAGMMGKAGLTEDKIIDQLKKEFQFDQPVYVRFFNMMKNYLCFDFGKSYFKGESVAKLIFDRLPISISLGLWSTFFIYGLSIPLGIMKAVRNGSRFDRISSILIVTGYAIPSFLCGLTFLILFAGGSFWSYFPLKGLFSQGWEDLSWWGKVKDYAWHVTLPVCAQLVGGFASLTLMTKNSFLEEIQKNYVLMARSVGFSEKAILTYFVFRNAMMIIISGLPATLLSIFFASSFLIESIFSLDGLGALSYEAIVSRDYPIIFGSLYIFSLLGLAMHIFGDWLYTLVDPRIDYQSRRS